MKKNKIVMVIVLMLCLFAGCGKSGNGTGSNGTVDILTDDEIKKKNEEFAELQSEYKKELEAHEAMAMKEEGIWDERYNEYVYTSAMTSAELSVSVNEKKSMTEEQRMTVLDYYEIWLQSMCDVGDSDYYDGDVTIYAVFYTGDDYEVKETARYKYVNGDIVDIPEEEQYQFPDPIFVNRDE